MEYGFNEIASDLRGYLRSGRKVLDTDPSQRKGTSTIEIDGVDIDFYYELTFGSVSYATSRVDALGYNEYDSQYDLIDCKIEITGLSTPYGIPDTTEEEQNELAKMIEDAITA